MAHLHITAWVIAFILLFVVNGLYKSQQNKPAKILSMILRLDYLIILYSGGSLLGTYIQNGAVNAEVIVKVIAGVWVIIAIEMITIRAKKGQPQKAWWIQFVIAALIAILLGFMRLPLGILP